MEKIKVTDIEGEVEIFVPDDLVGLKNDITSFCKENPYGKNVFIMLRCEEQEGLIEKAIRKQVEMFGLKAYFAEKDHFAKAVDDNVFFLALSSKYGLAVFPRLGKVRGKDYYNPNVCIELGYLKALHKDFRVIEDSKLGRLADVQVAFHNDFSTDNPETICIAVEKALQQMLDRRQSSKANLVEDNEFIQGRGEFLSKYWAASTWENISKWDIEKRYNGTGLSKVFLLKKPDTIFFGNKALLCKNTTERLNCTISQSLSGNFKGKNIKRLSFGGWSKILSRDLNLKAKSDYSIHLHIYFEDNTRINEVCEFTPSSYSQWQFSGKIIESGRLYDINARKFINEICRVEAKKIKEIRIFCVFRSCIGRVLFDKLFVRILDI